MNAGAPETPNNMPVQDPSSSQEPIENAAESTPEAQESATIAALMENLQVMAQERDEAKEAMLRAMADLQNFRRRAQQEKEQLRAVATQGLVTQLLPILDNFDRSIAALESGATVESVMEGVRGVDRQLRSALESVQLARIPAVGQPFDPEIHEAIGTDEQAELPENTVSMEIEAGYTMAGQVIRPAKVRVAKKP